MTSYYLSSRYSNAKMLNHYADMVEAALPEAIVLSTWHREAAQNVEDILTATELTANPDVGWYCAERVLHDMDAADTLVAFTGEGGKGGRHVEYGYAIATNMRLVVVGERDNVFYCHPEVEHFDTAEDWLANEGRRNR